VIERLISFSTPDSDVYGSVALAGERAAGLIAVGERVLALDDCAVTRGEGTLRLSGAGGELIVGLAAQTSLLGFETGEGRSVGVQAVGVSGETGGLEGLGGLEGFEATGVAWGIEGEEDQALLRALWGAFADGSLLVLFGLRPEGVPHHGTETLGAAQIAKDGAVISYEQPLLSTEYDAAGAPTRVTLELSGDEDAELPTRGAGSRRAGGSSRLGEGTLEAASLSLRLDGKPGVGGYEIFTA
jgi:hypothetical protein